VTSRPNLKDFSPERLREQLATAGLRPFRADQIVAWLYRRGVEDFDSMTDLPLEERRRIGAEFELRALEVAAIDRSRDGTVKAALRARDGSVVESVREPPLDPGRARIGLVIDFVRLQLTGRGACGGRLPFRAADQQRRLHGHGRAPA
jgi:hypothetical protein